ncbi:MAG: InlB B-repeat-containing protein, partial [Clostridia bacterium]|nr:InlB B-repeat-containing protein [Clostridia bacterium]
MNYLFKNRRVIAFILALVCFLSFDFALLAEDISSEIYESALEPGPSVEPETPEEEEPEEKIISEVISSEIQEEPEVSEEPAVSEESVASEEPQEEPGIEEKTEEEVKEEVETVKEEVKEVFLEDDDTDDGKKNGETEPGETSEVISSEIKEEDPEKEPEEDPSKAGEGEQEPESGTKAGDGPTFTVTFNVDGSEYATVDVPQGTAIGNLLPAAPTMEGYRFDRWDPEVNADTVIEEAMTVNAVFVKTWTVRFYNRDAEPIDTKTVDDGGSLTLPSKESIAREDYIAYWAYGHIEADGQTGQFKVDNRITTDSITVNEDKVIGPDYVPITYTITFYKEDHTTEVTTRTVTASTSYCLNDIPAVPTKSGYAGKWVYAGGDFSNTVRVTGDMSVWAEYDQNVFTVTYMVNDAVYKTETYYKGDKLVLPAPPAVEGNDFIGWFANDTQYNGGETINSDLTLTAGLSSMNFVRFVVLADDGVTEIETLSQFFRGEGETIRTMPQNPFVAGKVFEKWVIENTDTEVTADTVVTESFRAIAVFRTVEVYDITAEYYYINDNNAEVVFNTDLMQVEAHEIPYTITAPSTTQTDPDEVSGAPIYYPNTPTVTVNMSDFDSDKKAKVRIQYVPYTAEYDFVYKLKDLEGDGYTEIAGTREHIYGVLNSYVTPSVKTFDYATLEMAEGATITEVAGQELIVKYTRKNYVLSYETNGGSYVGGLTRPYGSTVTLSTTVPTRDGYTFDGWYLDEALTQHAGSSVTINGDTTLYAKWNPATVHYTIVYMIEKYDNDTNTTSFVYDNSRDATGLVGNTVYASSAPALTGNAYRGYEADTEFNATSSVTIAPDGSSVLIVHYKLIRYTLVFNVNNTNGRITINGQTYTGSNYKIENIVLGEEIGSRWPASSSEIYRTDNRYFDGWTGGPSTYITKQYELVWNHVQNANNQHVMTYTAQWDTSSYNRHAQYWLQQADGTWKVEEEYTQIGLNTNNLGAKEIDGYTKHNGNATAPTGYPSSGDNQTIRAWMPAFSDTYTDDGWHRNATPSTNERQVIRNGHTYTFDHAESYTTSWFQTYYRYVYVCNEPEGYQNITGYVYNFYYDRAQYRITYYDGGTVLRTTDPIFFEADISGSTYNYVPAKPAGKEDYTWGGWHADSSLQNTYTFGTMPGNNVAVYAKWIAPTFTVTFELDGGSPALDPLTVSKYEKVEKPSNPTKAGYTFDGWYTTADGTDLYDWNTQITSDTTIYAHWIRNTLGYTVKYQDETGNTIADDKIVSNPNFNVGQIITEQAIAVAGYRPVESSKSLTLSGTDSENVIIFVYSKKGETTSYKVKYILDPEEYPGNIPVAAEKIVNDVPGNTASVIELAQAVDYTTLRSEHPEFEGVEFFPDEVEKTFILTASAESNVYYFYYSSFKHADVKVHFVDMAGNKIADDDVQSLKVGKTFTLSRTPIAGWDLNKAVAGTSYSGVEAGTDYKITEEITSTGLEFTLYYQKRLTITVKGNSKQYDGTPLTLPEGLENQVLVDGLLDGDSLASLEYTYTNADSSDHKGRLNAGVETVTPHDATITGTHGSTPDYYNIRYISDTLEVTKINVTIRVEPDRWTGNVYDGTVRKTGFTNGSKTEADYIIISHADYAREYLDDIWDVIKEQATYDPSASGLGYYKVAESNAGDYPYNITLTARMLPQDPNYSVSIFVREGRLEIKPAPLTIQTGSAEKNYDGTPLTNDEVTVTGLIASDEDKVEITATGTITKPGTADNTYSIEWGTVASTNYTITDSLGTLTVKPATLTITVNTKTVPYNGQVQEGYTLPDTITGTGNTITADGYTVEGLANGDKISGHGYTAAKGTNAGTYKDSSFADIENFVITNSDNQDVTSYYVITVNKGNLVIEPISVKVTITEKSGTEKYDGKEKTVTGYTVSISNPLYTEADFTFSGNATVKGT